MQITIDIDTEKIDYEKITNQICEKIQEASIEDILEKSGAIDRALRNLFWQRIYEKFEKCMVEELRYLSKDTGLPTEIFKSEVKNNINNMIKEKFEKDINEIKGKLDQDALKEIMLKIAPGVMVAALNDMFYNGMFNMSNSLRDKAFEDAKGAIRYSFRSNNMSPYTPSTRDNLPATDY